MSSLTSFADERTQSSPKTKTRANIRDLLLTFAVFIPIAIAAVALRSAIWVSHFNF